MTDNNKEILRSYNPFESNVANEQQVNNKEGKVMVTDPELAVWMEELMAGGGEPFAATQKEERVANSRQETSEVQQPEIKNAQPGMAEVVTGEEEKEEKVERFMWMDKWYVGKPMPMTYEKLVELANDPMTSEIEDKIRLLDLEYPGHGSDYDEEKKALKNQLHFGLGHAWETTGDGSRKKPNMLLNRAAMFDGDHVGKNVREILAGILTLEFIEKNGIIFAHISPSGDGFHLLFDLLPGETIAQGQDRMAKVLGMEKEKDDAVYEENRGFFIVSRKNWLYVNPEKFYFANKEEAMKAAEEGRRVMNQKLDGSALNGNNGNETTNGNGNGSQNSSTPYNSAHARAYEGGEYPMEYDGAPYTKIVEKLLKKMNYTPHPNSKHDMYGKLINEFRCLCDNDPDWLFKVLPAWKDEKERYNQCTYYCKNYAYNSRPSAYLQAAIKEAKMEKSQEDYSVASMGFPPLNRVQKIVVSHVQEERQQALLVACNAPLGTLATSVRCKYNKTEEHSFSFGMFLIAPPGGGKSMVKDTFKYILAPLQEIDDKNEQIMQEYREECKRKNGKEKLNAKPDAPVRLNPINTTSAALADALQEAHGKHLFITETEAKNYVKCDRDSGGGLKIILQKNFDNEDCSQRRASVNGVNAHCSAYVNYFGMGTPKVVLRQWLTDDDLENGYMSRLVLLTLEKMVEHKEYTEYTEKEIKELYEIGTELMATEGTIYCPAADMAAKKWLEDNRNTAMATLGDYGDQFYHRAAVIGWRFGMLWALIEKIYYRSSKSKYKGTKKEKECEEYTYWCCEYVYRQFCRFFLEKTKRANQELLAEFGSVYSDGGQPIDYSKYSYKKYGPDDLLNDLPDVFTGPQIDELEKLKNYSYDRYQFVKRAKEKGQIIEIENKKYQKVSSLQMMEQNDMDLTI